MQGDYYIFPQTLPSLVPDAKPETVRSVKVPTSFKSTTTGKSYLVHTFVTCKTKGGIYLIECKSCGINALHGQDKEFPAQVSQ